MSKPIQLTINNSVAEINFNRPEAMNTLNAEMAHELHHVTNQVRMDQNIRVVCLKGNGKVFMAGGDIHFFKKNLNEMRHTALNIMQLLNMIIENLNQMAAIVVASVQGAVAGAGVSIMSACDLVIASKETKITTAYSKLGLSPDGGMSYFLPRVVGTKKAMELLLLAETITAQQAQEWGMINWLVTENEREDFTQKLIKKLNQSPILAHQSIKKLVNQSFENNLTRQLQQETEAFLACATSDDFKIGVDAFINKIPANFQGK